MIKVDVISGFLGAGKTTLIKKLFLSSVKNEKVALIENEFGEIGVDGAFLRESGIEIKEINSGCICCSLVGNFADSIKEIVDKYAPERIVIEPSGVGKLSDIVRAVEGVDCDLAVNIVATVVDGGKVKMYRKNFGEFYDDQVTQANTIVISKADKISQEKLEQSYAMLREMNPSATIITTPLTQIDGEKLLNTLEKDIGLVEELLRHLQNEHHHHHEDEECCCGHDHEHHHHHEDGECCCGHDHEHHHHHEDGECCCGHDHEHHHHHEDGECCCGHDHEHHHHHADEVFASWGKETVKAYTKEQLQNILSELETNPAYGMILRSKGIVRAADCNKWYYFDFVAGDWEIREGEPDVVGRVVVIGSKLNEAEIEVLFG